MQGLGPKLPDVNQIILNEEEEGDLSPAEKQKETTKPIQWQQVKNNNFGAADAIKKSNLLSRHQNTYGNSSGINF